MLDPADIDLATLAFLAGSAGNNYLLKKLHDAGFDGIRISHGYVIQRLVDDEPTVGELAEQLGITQQAASKTVAELEGLGYVTRHLDAGDSRVRRVRLTERGRTMLAHSRADRRALERSVRGELGEAKRALVSLLDATGSISALADRRVQPVTE
jgi:DNA-binding MarR family transcriptional regulator